jgi:hypothetical protein
MCGNREVADGLPLAAVPVEFLRASYQCAPHWLPPGYRLEEVLTRLVLDADEILSSEHPRQLGAFAARNLRPRGRASRDSVVIHTAFLSSFRDTLHEQRTEEV